MKRLDITTALDLGGLLLVAVGLALGLWQYVHGFGLILSGGVVIGGSYVAARNVSR